MPRRAGPRFVCRECLGAVRQVRSQWENRDFRFRNSDFLLKNILNFELNAARTTLYYQGNTTTGAPAADIDASVPMLMALLDTGRSDMHPDSARTRLPRHRPYIHGDWGLVRETMMNSALKTRNCALKTRNYVSKTRNVVFQMMNFA